MMKLGTKIFLILLVGFSTSASAVMLEPVDFISQADANFCGDINEIATFKITDFESELAYGRFSPSEETLNALKNQLAERYYLQDEDFAIIAQWEMSVAMLTKGLGLKRLADGSYTLSSCHDLSVLPLFALEQRGDELVPTNMSDSQVHYFTVGVNIGGARDFSGYTIHAFVNLREETLRTFLAW